MSETVKVVSASNPNPWEHGITFYDMVFERGGQNFSCSWGTKGGEPQPGEEVTGEFAQKSDGSWKFSKGSKDKPQGGSHEASAGSSRPSQGSDTRDNVGARIERQAVLKVLSPLICQDGGFSKHHQTEVERIEAFIAEAGQTSNPTQGPQGQGDTSPPPAPPASDSSVSREHQEICEALDVAGLLYPAAKDFVADYMLSELPPERIKKAVGNLVGQDLELQATTLTALKAAAESWSGKLVPVPDDEPVF